MISISANRRARQSKADKQTALYREHGCRDRGEYLRQLVQEYDAPLDAVSVLADLLGPDEDFDGLVAALQDGDW